MEQERSNTPHYWIRAIILLGYTFYITQLVSSGNLIYYIAPRMTPYVKYASILLFGMAMVQVYLALQSNREENEKDQFCDCEPIPSRSKVINIGIYSLFIMPLLLGFVLPDTAMGSSIVSIKGMNLGVDASLSQNVVRATTNTTIAVTEDDETLKEMFQAVDQFSEEYALLAMKLYKKELITIEEEGFMELLDSIDLYIDHFIGKKVTLKGFVYREDDMLPNQFVISRLAMQCCSADTAPYGIMVESDTANQYAEDTWVEVTGIIGKTTYNSNTIMKIDGEQLVITEASKTAYIYPYFEDLMNLGN